MTKSVTFLKIISTAILGLALTACGGGSGPKNFGTPGTGDTPTTVSVSAIELSVSSRQMPSDGSAPVTITAIAKDENNNAIDGANILFSVDKDATIIKNATVTTNTDSNDGNSDTDNDNNTNTSTVTAGSIQTATLAPGSKTNQTVTVTASSGGQSQSIAVQIIGTNVVIDGPTGVTIGKQNPFVLKLKDSSNNPIAFQPVTITSTNGNTITTDSNFVTDAAGEIAFTLTSTTTGTDTLTTSVLGASYSKTINISGDDFSIASTTEEITINTPTTITFKWLKNGVPQTGKPIILSATRGIIPNQTAVTNGAGIATFSISSNTAGPTVITATSTEGLSTSIAREFIATTPAYLNTQASPSLVAPNKSSTIIAKIRDIDDNPVKNKIIDFRLNDTVGGVLSASTAVTDSAGRASISYTAGNASSAKDGVIIRTYIQGYPSVAEDVVRLTVGGNALRITLGDDNKIASENVYYIKQFGVIVTDSAGNPIKNQPVSFKINPIRYFKGNMWLNGTAWTNIPRFVNNVIVDGVKATCEAEDFNKNGKLDRGEDINNSGVLEPTNDATVTTSSGTTDDNGKLVVQVVYPKNTALWSEQRIEATTTVSGTEFIEYTDFVLPILADDANDAKVSPPNLYSPYGVFGGCTEKPPGVPPVINPIVAAGDAITGEAVNQMENNIWYSLFSDGQRLDASLYTITNSVAVVEFGPNSTFRFKDSNTALDNSGFYINVVINGSTSLFYYKDNDAVIPPPPPTDTTPPVVTLTGSSTITLNVGDVYTEQGANATDLKDGVITVQIVGNVPVNGSNQTTTAGTFTLFYRATDNDGNTSSVTRTVTVNP